MNSCGLENVKKLQSFTSMNRMTTCFTKVKYHKFHKSEITRLKKRDIWFDILLAISLYSIQHWRWWINTVMLINSITPARQQNQSSDNINLFEQVFAFCVESLRSKQSISHSITIHAFSWINMQITYMHIYSVKQTIKEQPNPNFRFVETRSKQTRSRYALGVIGVLRWILCGVTNKRTCSILLVIQTLYVRIP